MSKFQTNSTAKILVHVSRSNMGDTQTVSRTGVAAVLTRLHSYPLTFSCVFGSGTSQHYNVIYNVPDLLRETLHPCTV